jgi:hypothetical protein
MSSFNCKVMSHQHICGYASLGSWHTWQPTILLIISVVTVIMSKSQRVSCLGCGDAFDAERSMALHLHWRPKCWAIHPVEATNFNPVMTGPVLPMDSFVPSGMKDDLDSTDALAVPRLVCLAGMSWSTGHSSSDINDVNGVGQEGSVVFFVFLSGLWSKAEHLESPPGNTFAFKPSEIFSGKYSHSILSVTWRLGGTRRLARVFDRGSPVRE